MCVLPSKHVLQRLCDNEVIIMRRKFCVLHLSDQDIYMYVCIFVWVFLFVDV